ncbi:hypothetical protein F5Y12DRAFT_771612, partial [Xylaria sp. FL1777]
MDANSLFTVPATGFSWLFIWLCRSCALFRAVRGPPLGGRGTANAWACIRLPRPIFRLTNTGLWHDFVGCVPLPTPCLSRDYVASEDKCPTYRVDSIL